MDIKKLQVILAFCLSPYLLIGCGEKNETKNYRTSYIDTKKENNIPVDIDAFEESDVNSNKTAIIENKRVSYYRNTDLYKDMIDSDELKESYVSCKVLTEHKRLKAISAPKNYNQPKEKMKIYYEMRPSEDGKAIRPDDKTLVYVVGGPVDRISNVSMASFTKYEENGYNLLLVDPRGAGCNYIGDSNKDINVDSVELARDIINIIHSEGLTNYTLHAHSYGTVQATYMLSLMDKEYKDIPKPKVAFFEGIIGKSMDSYRYWIDLRVKSINKALLKFPSIHVLFDDTAENNKIKGIDKSYWVALVNGAIEKELNLETNEVLKFVVETSKAIKSNELDQDLMSDLMISSEEFLSEASKFKYTKFQEKLRCEEIVTTLRNDKFKSFVYVDGKMTISSKVLSEYENACSKYSEKNYFESKKLKFTTPVLYIHGSDDEKVSIESGRYHFDSQENSKSYFLEVQGEAHEPANNVLNECFIDLVKAFEASQEPEGNFNSVKALTDSRGRCI